MGEGRHLLSHCPAYKQVIFCCFCGCKCHPCPLICHIGYWFNQHLVFPACQGIEVDSRMSCNRPYNLLISKISFNRFQTGSPAGCTDDLRKGLYWIYILVNFCSWRKTCTVPVLAFTHFSKMHDDIIWLFVGEVNGCGHCVSIRCPHYRHSYSFIPASPEI